MKQQFEQLVAYINQQSERGVSKEAVRQALLQAGHNAQTIDEALAAAGTPAQSVAAPQMPPQQHAVQPTQQSEQGAQPPHQQPAAPAKYRVFRALADAVVAAKNNALSFFAATVVSYALAVLGLFIAGVVLGSVLFSSLTFTGNWAIALLLMLLVYGVWYILAYSFVFSSVSLALFNGATGQKTGTAATLRRAVIATGRVIGANALLAVVFVSPMVLVLLLYFAVRFPSPILFLLILASVVWQLVALLRFALVPYVALFEPEIPLRKTLTRSSHLLKKGGQWFLVKGFLLIMAILIAVSAATGQTLREVESGNDPLSFALLIVLTLAVNGALVMLYLNRRQVKG
jgi:hypothetical protein